MQRFVQTWRERTGRIALSLCAMVTVANSSTGQIPCGYEITHVIEAPGCVGGNSLTPTGISSDGRYVAAYYGVCFSGDTKAAVYDTVANQLTTIPLPAGFSDSKAWGVNIVGQVCGTANKSNVGQRGFVYELGSGVWTELPSQNGANGWSHADAINDSGVVCGYRSLDDGDDPVNPWNAFVWSAKSGFIDLGVMTGVRSEARDISDTGHVCGWTGNTGVNARAFIWHDGKLQILPEIPGGLTSFGHGVNQNGEVVGSGRLLLRGNIVSQPFRWKDGVFTLLSTLADLESGVAAEINANGVIVGVCSDLMNGSNSQECIWSDGTLIGLNALVSEVPDGLTLEDRSTIADSNHILLRGTVGNGFVAVMLAPVEVVTGDTNCDQTVDVDDLLAVINNWGECDDCVGDLNLDNSVDSLDLVIVVTNWTF